MLGAEHLLGHLLDLELLLRLVVARSDGGALGEEEVRPWEGNQIGVHLPHVLVKHPRREPGCAADTRHRIGNYVVDVRIGGLGKTLQLGGDIVECLVVEDHHSVSVLDEVVDRQRCVVRLNHTI